MLLAVRNEATSIGACLAAVAAQEYPSALLELIVADGGSNDGTTAIVDDRSLSMPFPVSRIENPSGTTAAGFNRALQASSGEIVVILGARARPAPNFVAASVQALAESGADAVGGVVKGRATGAQAKAISLALGSRFGTGDARYRYASSAGDVDTVNYGAYWREVFVELGGFDETMINVEDDEFNYRMRAHGRRLFLSPSIQAEYVVRPSIAALARQYARYAYPKVRVLRRHPLQMRPRQFAPAVFVGSLAIAAALAPWWPVARRLLCLVIGAYAGTAAAVSLLIARREGMRYLPLLPLAFLCLHAGYGAASLAGAARFGLWRALSGTPEPACVPIIAPPDPAATAEGD